MIKMFKNMSRKEMILAIVSIIGLVLGYLIFRKLKRNFVEEL